MEAGTEEGFSLRKILFPTILVLTLVSSFFLLINSSKPLFFEANLDSDILDQAKLNDLRVETHIGVSVASKNLSDRVLIEEYIKLGATQVENIFARYNSPMAGYGELIVRKAYECGGDYKVLVAIAGNESGFGRIPYKLYNPFGYLNGVQYSSWAESLGILSCEISQRHLAPCNNVVSCIIVRYGGPDTDKERWVRNINFFINQIY